MRSNFQYNAINNFHLRIVRRQGEKFLDTSELVTSRAHPSIVFAIFQYIRWDSIDRSDKTVIDCVGTHVLYSEKIETSSFTFLSSRSKKRRRLTSDNRPCVHLVITFSVDRDEKSILGSCRQNA